MSKELKQRKALRFGTIFAVMAGTSFASYAQNPEPPLGNSTKPAVEATEEVVSVAPPGSRFLIPGRTLLLAPLDGSAPAVVEGTELEWDAFNTKLSGIAQSEFYHASVPENKEAEMRARVIEDLVLENLMVIAANERGIVADEEEIQKSLDAVELRYRGNEKWEEQRDRTLPKIRAEYTKRSLLAQLEKQVREVDVPTFKQSRAFYDSNPKLFTEPETQNVSVILLGVDPSSHISVWGKAETEAKGILKKIKNGGDFAAIAKLRSTDESAGEGGALGYLHRGMLSDEAQKVVDKMQPGEVSEPIRILQGFAIFKLNDRTQERLVSFSKSQPRVAELYKRTKAQEQWDEMKKSLRAKANVVINPILLMPEAPSKEEANSNVSTK